MPRRYVILVIPSVEKLILRNRCKVGSWIVSVGVKSHYCLLTASSIGIETAAFPGQSEEEIDRLLHIVFISLAHNF
jgi:hypothetical protein